MLLLQARKSTPGSREIQVARSLSQLQLALMTYFDPSIAARLWMTLNFFYIAFNQWEKAIELFRPIKGPAKRWEKAWIYRESARPIPNLDSMPAHRHRSACQRVPADKVSNRNRPHEIHLSNGRRPLDSTLLRSSNCLSLGSRISGKASMEKKKPNEQQSIYSAHILFTLTSGVQDS